MPAQHPFDLGSCPAGQHFGKIDQGVGIPEDAELRPIDAARRMMLSNDPCRLVDEHRIGAELFEDPPGNWRPFDLLEITGIGTVATFRLVDADIVQIGNGQSQDRVGIDIGEQFTGMAGNGVRMGNPPRIGAELRLHRLPDIIYKFLVFRHDGNNQLIYDLEQFSRQLNHYFLSPRIPMQTVSSGISRPLRAIACRARWIRPVQQGTSICTTVRLLIWLCWIIAVNLSR